MEPGQAVEGDLDELYKYWYQRAGKIRATVGYLFNVVSVLPPFVRQRKSKNDYTQPLIFRPAMIRNNFKIAFRGLTKNPLFSLLNTLGLAIGMAFALLVGLWVRQQLSYDGFHKHGEPDRDDHEKQPGRR